MEMRQNIFLKYEDYLREYPFVKAFQLRCKILAREHITDGRYDYFGDRMQTMRHGNYGISLRIFKNKVLSIYEGSWREDRYAGKGVLYTISHPKTSNKMLRIMEGEWDAGKLHGRGCIRNYEGTKKQWVKSYEGDFKEGEKWGLGIETCEGSLYRGEFEKGCRTGQGRLEDSYGNFFDGQFEKGFLVGESYQSVGDTFIITDGDYHKKIFRKPQDSREFTERFSQLIHQIVSIKK